MTPGQRFLVSLVHRKHIPATPRPLSTPKAYVRPNYKTAFPLLSKSIVQADRLYRTLFIQEVTFENKPSHLKRTPPPAKQSHGDTCIHRGILVLHRGNRNTLAPLSTTWQSDNCIS